MKELRTKVDLRKSQLELGDSGPCRSVFRDMPITASGVVAIMIPG
jgi:hypothetical protein